MQSKDNKGSKDRGRRRNFESKVKKKKKDIKIIDYIIY